MSWLILGVCLLAGAFLGARWFMSADPKALAKIMRWGGIAVFALLIVYLAVTGRFLLVPPLVVLGLMIWRRVRGGGAGSWFSGLRRPPSPGQASDVETLYLRMSLDHDSGAISGEVRRGRFEGRELADLSFDELLELLAECRQHDAQSAQLIESYLDRVKGPEWRERSGAGDGDDGGGGQQRRGARAAGATMTREEAYQVLGLDDGASAADVKEAHRRLILKIHPDQGGSNYLAAKINQAKEFLLGS
jgi:hypothetical protein